MSDKVLKSLHGLADKLGRPSGQYIPEVEVIKAAIKEICRLRKVATP